MWNEPKPPIKYIKDTEMSYKNFNKNITVPNLARLGPKN